MRKIFFIMALLLCVTFTYAQKYDLSRPKLNSTTLDQAKKINELKLDNQNTNNIEVNCSSEKLNLDSVFDHVEFLALETKQNCFIGRIDKIIVRDTLVYINSYNSKNCSDEDIGKSLFVFNFRDGKFIREIGKTGKNPREYTEPSDFVVTNTGIVILDHYGRRLLHYNHDGTYRGTTTLGFIVTHIAKTNNDSIYWGIALDNRHIKEIDEYKLLKFNSKGEILSKSLKLEYALNFSNDDCLQTYNGDLTYRLPFSSEVYLLNDTIVELESEFNFDKQPLPNDFVVQCKGDYEKFYRRYRAKSSYLTKYLYTEDYILAQYQIANTPRLPRTLIYDKKKRAIISNGKADLNGLDLNINDIIGLSLGETFSCYDNNYIVGCLPSWNVTALNLSPEFIQKVTPKTDSVTSDQNPILFKVKLK